MTRACSAGKDLVVYALTNELIIIDKTLDTSGNKLTEMWTYTDEFLRPLVVSRETMSSGWNRVNSEYDKEKNLKRQTAPFWWGGGTQYWTNFTYDRRNRLINHVLAFCDGAQV